MKKLNINIPISEEILFILKKDEEALKKEILKILAIKLFSEKSLSLGKCAELAGMNKNDFVDLLGQHNIDIYQYSEKELERELDFISSLTENGKN